jgi:hypothetical protein
MLSLAETSADVMRRLARGDSGLANRRETDEGEISLVVEFFFSFHFLVLSLFMQVDR